MTSPSAPQKNLANALASIDLLPDWELLPNQFFAGHRFVAGLKIREWRTGQPDLSLQQAVAKYLDIVPADLPAEVIVKLTKLVIEVFEKQQAAELVTA